MDKRRTYNLWYFVVAMLLFGAFQLWLSYRSIETITYSQLLDRLKAGTIAEVTITESMIEGRYKTTRTATTTSSRAASTPSSCRSSPMPASTSPAAATRTG